MHDVAVAVAVGATVAVTAVVSAGTARPLPLILGMLAAAVLIGRRRAPLSTLVASSGLVLVVFHLDARFGPAAVLAPAVALFSLALTRGRVQQIAAALVAIALVIGADLVRPGQMSLLQTLAHMALVSIPLLAAEAHRNRRSYVSLLEERLALAQRTQEQQTQRRVEQERLRIARDLHDLVAHTLTTINVQAGTAAALIDHDAGYAKAALQTIEDASRDATVELRAVLGVLRDRETADPADAPRTPAPSVEDISDLVRRARDGGLNVRLTISGDHPDRLLDAVSLAAYRIVQESLTNVHRHAAGATVHVAVGYDDDRLRVTVHDDGGSSRPTTPRPSGGVGISGMTERAAALGGSLRAAPSRNGFVVEAELPYAAGST